MPGHASRFRTPGRYSRHLGPTLGTVPLAPPQTPAPLLSSPMAKDMPVSSPNAEAGQLSTSLSPEALQPLIKETLRQLGIQGTEQSGSAASWSSGQHRSTPARKMALVKEQQKLMSKNADKDWKVIRGTSLYSHTFLIFAYRLQFVTSGDKHTNARQQIIFTTTSLLSKLKLMLSKTVLNSLWAT